MKTSIIFRTIILFIAFVAIQNEILSQKDTISNKASIIKITDIKISGQSIFLGKHPELNKQYEKDSTITLKSDSKNIEIFYDINDSSRKETDFYIFSYIMHGHENEWNISGKSRVVYNDLRPGKYRFELKCFKNGVWNEKEVVTFSITMKPEFYMTSWFLSLYLIAIPLLILIIIKVDKNIELKTNLLIWSLIYVTILIFNLVEIMDDLMNNQQVTSVFIIKEIFLIPGILYAFIAPFINFYLFYFLLVPKFLFRKKVFQFIILAVLSSIVVGYLARLTWAGAEPIRAFIPYIIFTLVTGFIGFATKKIVLWRKSVAEKIILHKKLYASKTALIMLQAQLNPHFLFNSLNNIDILVEENPKTASDYLKKLSDILRYVLYETKETETELSKEIDQIKSYIELQKIRTDNPHYVIFKIKGEIKDQKIAPMIFIPFVENAFKHCKNKTIENAIDIEFEINNDSVKMNCKNYFEESKVEVIKSEGLGIETIKQRLNLLYQKNHELVIDKTGNWFNVSLSINLK